MLDQMISKESGRVSFWEKLNTQLSLLVLAFDYDPLEGAQQRIRSLNLEVSSLRSRLKALEQKIDSA